MRGYSGRLLGALAALSAVLLLVLAGPAQARDSFGLASSYSFGGNFGTNGPGMMAVHEDSDTLYVVDPSNNRILKFDISDPLSPQPENFSALTSNAITQADGSALVLAQGSNLAIDNSGGPQDGTIYLATNTAANSRAHAFAASGEWLYEFREDDDGEFDPNGDPQLGKGVAVPSAGPRAGEILRLGTSVASSTFYTPSSTPGGEPTTRANSVGSASFAALHRAWYALDGETLGTWNGGPVFSGQLRDGENLAQRRIYVLASLNTLTGAVRDLAPSATQPDTYFVKIPTQFARVALVPDESIAVTPEVIDEFAVGSPPSGTGMLHTPDDVLYVANGADAQIDIYAPAEAPDAEMLPTEYIDSTTSRIRASINPQGIDIIDCEFEYKLSTSFLRSSAPCDPLPGSGSSASEVGADIAVTAGGTYTAQVLVTGADGEFTRSEEIEFQAPRLPEAETLPAGPQQRSGTAVLGGTVNPNGTNTRFYIEYSTEPDLSNARSWPESEDAEAGNAGSDTRVWQMVEGLEPNTEYFFRLVAVTNAGPDEGAIESFRTFTEGSKPEPTNCANAPFRTGASALLPDCRAWERVSNSESSGGQRLRQGFTIARADGNRVSFNAPTYMEDAELFGTINSYVADRQGDQWQTTSIAPAPRGRASGTVAYAFPYMYVTPDLSTFAGWSPQLAFPGLTADNSTIYMYDYEEKEAFPAVSVITDGSGGNATGALRLALRGLSDDGSVAAVQGTGLPVDSGPYTTASFSSYWWVKGEGLSLASTMPGTGAPADGGGAGPMALSSDGEKMLWWGDRVQPRSTSRDLYLSRRGESTLWISQAAAGTPQPTPTHVQQNKVAWTDDLRYVFFGEGEKLTDDSTANGFNSQDLYRYDTETQELIDLTTEDPNGGKLEEIWGMSDDGETVYFIANGNFDGATGTGPKLYVAESENVKLIGPVSTMNTNNDRNSVFTDPYNRISRVSSDGRYLLFAESGAVDGSINATVYDTGGHRQLYRYDRDEDRVDCVSCDPRGIPGTASAFLTMPALQRHGGSSPGRGEERMMMRDDGLVMFTTAHALVPEDQNDVADTYLWDGDTRLLTSGHSEHGEWAETATPDFSSIFVQTMEQLVPADDDTIDDLYVARIGGGIAAQQVRPVYGGVGCEGAECQGLGSESPGLPQLSSTEPPEEAAPGAKCLSQRARAQRVAKAARQRLNRFRQARRQVRTSTARLKRTRTRVTRVRAGRSVRALKRSKAQFNRAARAHRQARSALARCQGGGS